MRRMVARRSRSQRASAAEASSSAAWRVPRRTFSGFGVWPRRRSSASPREWAGSAETARTRRPASARATACAAAQVVLPTPPLPPKRERVAGARSRLREAEVRFDSVEAPFDSSEAAFDPVEAPFDSVEALPMLDELVTGGLQQGHHVRHGLPHLEDLGHELPGLGHLLLE